METLLSSGRNLAHASRAIECAGIVHASHVLQAYFVTRVEPDPPQGQTGALKPTTQGRYVRLLGSPKAYYSSYSAGFLAALRTQRSDTQHPELVIFNNTASGAALLNVLSLRGGCQGD